MIDRKHMGCCTVCDVPIFEIVSRYTEGPLKGDIRAVGRALPGAKRYYIVRASGRHSFWSACAVCEIRPENMADLNRKELRSMVLDSRLSPKDSAQVEMNAKMLRLFQWDIPLGVLGEKPWMEVR